MKPGFLWQVLLAIAGLTLILSLLAGQRQIDAISEQTATPMLPSPTPTATPSPTPIPDDVKLCFVDAAVPGGWLVEGIVGAPLYPNPVLKIGNPVDAQLVDLLFDGLVRMDELGRPQPALAQSWDISNEGKTVRFTLRDGLLWHDGLPVTVNDIVYTYNLLKSGQLPGGIPQPWESVTLSQIGDRSVEFTLEQPYAPFLEAATVGILPAHLLEGTSAELLPASQFNSFPIGTGPFRIASSWTQTGNFRLLPNEQYWNGRVQIDGLDIRFFADERALAESFAAGELHAMIDVEPAGIPLVTTLPGVRLYTSADTQYTQLLFNLSESGHPSVQEPAIRRAFAYATDRNALVGTALYGQGLPFDGPYLTNSWAYSPEVTGYETDIAAATEIITSTGLITSATTFDLLARNQPTERTIAQQLQTQWAAVGITATITFADAEQYFAALQGRAFDLALVEIDPLADPDLYDFWSQDAIIRGQNYSGWNDFRASEALEAGRQLWEVESRYPHYISFLSRYDAAVPALSLYQAVQTYAIHESVAGATFGRIAYPRDRFQTLPNWTIETEKQVVPCDDMSE